MFVARTKLRYKFGVKVPRDEKEAKKFDGDNGNKLWEEAIKKALVVYCKRPAKQMKTTDPSHSWTPSTNWLQALLKLWFPVLSMRE